MDNQKAPVTAAYPLGKRRGACLESLVTSMEKPARESGHRLWWFIYFFIISCDPIKDYPSQDNRVPDKFCVKSKKSGTTYYLQAKARVLTISNTVSDLSRLRWFGHYVRWKEKPVQKRWKDVKRKETKITLEHVTDDDEIQEDTMDQSEWTTAIPCNLPTRW